MSEQLDRAVQSISLKTGCFHQPAFGFPQRAAESFAGKHVPPKPSPSAATRVTSHLCMIFHPVIPLSLPSRAKINKLTNKQSLGEAVAEGEAPGCRTGSARRSGGAGESPPSPAGPRLGPGGTPPRPPGLASRCSPSKAPALPDHLPPEQRLPPREQRLCWDFQRLCAFVEVRVNGAASVKTATEPVRTYVLYLPAMLLYSRDAGVNCPRQ